MIYDQELEQSVIGGLLQTSEPLKLLVSLTAEDFATPEYRAMFTAMQLAAGSHTTRPALPGRRRKTFRGSTWPPWRWKRCADARLPS